MPIVATLPRARSRRPFRLLLVDDDASFLEIVSILVADHLPGVLLQTARSGVEALRQMAAQAPQLLMADVVMPHMDGLEMLRHLATQPHRPPVVVLTSVLDADDMQSYGEMPADALFMPKPLDQDAFVRLVRAASSAAAGAAD
ncbi:MAG TPA: response regulator [Albitalea sp.]|nr:response regulator [Albitalea sp.]